MQDKITTIKEILWGNNSTLKREFDWGRQFCPQAIK
jgi:hypothetical protein